MHTRSHTGKPQAKATAGHELGRAVRSLRACLLEIIGFYNTLIEKLRIKYGLALEGVKEYDSFGMPIVESSTGGGNRMDEDATSVEKADVLQSVHRCYVFVGDLGV